jgi:hypothetical protein
MPSQGRHKLHQRVDVAANNPLAGFHALDNRQGRTRSLIALQKSAVSAGTLPCRRKRTKLFSAQTFSAHAPGRSLWRVDRPQASYQLLITRSLASRALVVANPLHIIRIGELPPGATQRARQAPRHASSKPASPQRPSGNGPSRQGPARTNVNWSIYFDAAPI